jgi:arginase
VLAASLPERPVVLGGCCCAHVGAVRGLVARGGRLGVVWLDAHGDLNTPETSPSGNEWGMPLRMLVDAAVVPVEDVALVGARNLDPPEAEFMVATGLDDSLDRALEGVDAVYVALDLDVLDPSEIAVFVPEPDGPGVSQIESILRDVSARARVTGIGATGLVPDESNLPTVTRLLAAAGF